MREKERNDFNSFLFNPELEKITPQMNLGRSFDFLEENIPMDPGAPVLKLRGLGQTTTQESQQLPKEFSIVFTPALNFFPNPSPVASIMDGNSSIKESFLPKEQLIKDEKFPATQTSVRNKPPVNETLPNDTGRVSHFNFEATTKAKGNSPTTRTDSIPRGKSKNPSPIATRKGSEIVGRSKDTHASHNNHGNQDPYSHFAHLSDFLIKFFKSESTKNDSLSLRAYEWSILKSFISRKFNKSIKTK
jgi:hypothetical protein